MPVIHIDYTSPKYFKQHRVGRVQQNVFIRVRLQHYKTDRTYQITNMQVNCDLGRFW